MMVFVGELKKLITDKLFIILSIVLLLINSLYVVMKCASERGDIAPYDVYNQVLEDMYSLPENSWPDMLDRYIDEQDYSIFHAYDDTYSDTFSVDALFYATDLRNAASEILNNLNNCKETQKSIVTLTNKAYEYSKKYSEKSFEYRMYRRIGETYKKLEDTEYGFVEYRGFDCFFSCDITDYIIILFGFVCISLLFIRNRNSGLGMLVKATAGGRKRYVASVFLASCLTEILFACILFASSFFLVSGFYSLDYLNVPIQNYIHFCPFSISVGGYIVLSLLCHIVIYMVVLSCFFLLTCLIRREQVMAVVTIIAVSTMIFLDRVIEPVSWLSFLRAVNPFSLLHTEEHLSELKLINLFGIPVSRFGLYIVIVISVTLIMIVGTVIVYSLQDEQTKKISLKGRHRKAITTDKVFWHECYKLLFMEKGLLFICVGIILAIVLFNPVTDDNMSSVEILYDNISGDYIGKYDESIEKDIENRLEAVYKVVEEEGDSDYTALLAAYNMSENYAKYLSDKSDAYYINNKAFDALTGTEWQFNVQTLFSIIISSSLIITGVVFNYSCDYDNGMMMLIWSTPYGKSRYMKTKANISLLFVVILYILFFIPIIIQSLLRYGTDYILTSARNIQELSTVPDFISILGVIILRNAGILLLLIVIGMISGAVVRKCKSPLPSILGLLGGVEIPLLTYAFVVYMV